MRKKKHHIILFLAMLLSACTWQQLQAQTPSTANQLKAVFIYNFTQFVDWPSSVFNSNSSPFVIGVLGHDPFGSYLESVVEGEKYGSHPIVVQRYKSLKEINTCHILYVSENASSAIKDLKNRSILTVGDQDDFATSGGMIRFFLEKSKIRLQINLGAAKAANLTISSKLLRVSDVVN